MKHASFGSELRQLLTSANLPGGQNEWFRETLGMEDRSLRRWLSGQHLPSEDNWKKLIQALKKEREQDAVFLTKLNKLQERFPEEQARVALAQRQASSLRSRIRPPAVIEPEPYEGAVELEDQEGEALETSASATPKPRDPIGLQRLWKKLTSTSLHRVLGDMGWAWAAEPFLSGKPIREIRLTYRTSGPRYSVPSAGKTAFARWCATSSDAARLEREPWGLQLRLAGARFNHRIHQYEIHLAPTKFLFYRAIQHNLWKPEYRRLRTAAFENALLGLDRDQPLVLPSTFAIHMGVVSSDGKALLRRRSKRTELYPLAWEAGLGEFMHGPHRTRFPHFTRKGIPSLFLFLKNTVAEELNYFGARPGDFKVFGFAAEFLTLAPKLMVVYFSDAPMDDLLKCARTSKDSAQALSAIELTVDGLACAFIDKRHRAWGPTSKLALLLALMHFSAAETSLIRQLELRRKQLSKSRGMPTQNKNPHHSEG